MIQAVFVMRISFGKNRGEKNMGSIPKLIGCVPNYFRRPSQRGLEPQTGCCESPTACLSHVVCLRDLIGYIKLTGWTGRSGIV
jgi:hypothetical protein